MHIPIPEGLQVPQDGNTKPFKLSGMFIAMGDKLMPLQLDGLPVTMPKDEDEDMGREMEEGSEHEYEEEDSCCGECGNKMGRRMGGRGNSFMIAIERSMKRK
jgi:hypothetical protein